MYFFSWLLLRKITTEFLPLSHKFLNTCMETAWQFHLILTWWFFLERWLWKHNHSINIPRHIASAMSSSISHRSSLLSFRQEPILACRFREASSVIKRTNTNEYHTVPILFNGSSFKCLQKFPGFREYIFLSHSPFLTVVFAFATPQRLLLACSISLESSWNLILFIVAGCEHPTVCV